MRCEPLGHQMVDDDVVALRVRRQADRPWRCRTGLFVTRAGAVRSGRRRPPSTARSSSPPPRAQRFRDRQRRLQTGQRIGDRVAAEPGGVGGADHQPPDTAASSPNATQSARSPAGAVAGDPQPDPAVASARMSGPEAAACQCRGPRRLDARRRRRRAACAVRPDASKSTAYESFPLFIQSKNAGGPCAGTVRPRAALDLDDGRACLARADCPHSGPAHIDDRSATSSSASAARCADAHPPSDPGWLGGGLTEHGDGKTEQAGTLGERRRDRRRAPSARQRATGRRPHRPRPVGLHQRGHGVDVVRSRQRQRAPTVTAGHQPGGPARRDAAMTAETRAARRGRRAVARRRPSTPVSCAKSPGGWRAQTQERRQRMRSGPFAATHHDHCG